MRSPLNRLSNHINLPWILMFLLIGSYGARSAPTNSPQLHWAYAKPSSPPPPRLTRDSKWVRNDIDHFILDRLHREGLRPAPEANRETLIRRLSFDLTGLPPTWHDVQTFLKDKSPNAYENLVDRLLQSPHYGEHMARWWLDLARYADSNGYQVDLARSIWPYRDWVIQAFNRNMPFDQFTIEQLAGDLLPHATLQQKIATGFNRNSKINDEGGGDAEEYRTKAVKDRVATTASVWLASTLACAECHNHKYDPISQEEYYKFYAFFNNTADGGNYSVEPTIPVPPPPLQNQVDFLRRNLAERQQRLAQAEANLAREPWIEQLRGKSNVWTPLSITSAISTGGATFTNLPDSSILATGISAIYDTYHIETVSPTGPIRAILLEVLPDPALPKNGPGRWEKSGNFILDEFTVTALPPNHTEPAATSFTVSNSSAGSATGIRLQFRRAEADWEQEFYRAEHAIDQNPKTGWAIGPQFGQRHFLIAELAQPFVAAPGSKLQFRFDQYHGNAHTIGRLRLSVTSEENPQLRWPIPPEIAALLHAPAPDPAQSNLLAQFLRSASPAIRHLDREIFRLNQREAALASMKSSTLVMQELSQPRKTRVHLRGNFLDPGPEVSPDVPAVFPPLPRHATVNRLTLAQWIVHPENPLTARVTVNRLWERLFGTGLVKTSEDFGLQSEAPSHPELLDWLAVEFMRQHWDIRAVLKSIVTSSTYRQQSHVTPALLEKDPFNRLLSRGSRFRWDAETIRDLALAVSGLLNAEVGGPSVYPKQPPNLWKEIGFLRPEIGMDEWPVSIGPDLYRRGVYTFWRRVCTYPTFTTFDAPSRDSCISRRPRTNTPLQALAALNDPVFIEAARALANRILAEGGPNPAAQAEFAFRLCLSRKPDPREKSRLLAFYQQQAASFERDPSAALQWVTYSGEWPAPSVPATTLAAWMMTANVLLNLDETVTRN